MKNFPKQTFSPSSHDKIIFMNLLNLNIHLHTPTSLNSVGKYLHCGKFHSPDYYFYREHKRSAYFRLKLHYHSTFKLQVINFR